MIGPRFTNIHGTLDIPSRFPRFTLPRNIIQLSRVSRTIKFASSWLSTSRCITCWHALLSIVAWLLNSETGCRYSLSELTAWPPFTWTEHRNASHSTWQVDYQHATLLMFPAGGAPALSSVSFTSHLDSCEVNSGIKVYTMQWVMSIRYIKSFYIYIQGLSWWLKIFNSFDTNTFKAAQSNEIMKSSNPKKSFQPSLYTLLTLQHTY